MKRLTLVPLLILAMALSASAHAPTVTLDPLGPFTFSTYPQIVYVTGTVVHDNNGGHPQLDALKDLALSVNGTQVFLNTSGTGATFSIPWTIAAEGSYRVNVSVTHGNKDGTADTGSDVTTVIIAPPSTNTEADYASISLTNTSFDPYTFLCQVTNGTVTNYAWDFDDGTTIADGNATQTHAFVNGTYTVKCQTNFSDGSTLAATLPITVAIAPNTTNGTNTTGGNSTNTTINTEADFASIALTNLSIDPHNFTCTITNGTPTNYAWDFDDGTTIADGNATQTHQFVQNGTFVVNCSAAFADSSVLSAILPIAYTVKSLPPNTSGNTTNTTGNSTNSTTSTQADFASIDLTLQDTFPHVFWCNVTNATVQTYDWDYGDGVFEYDSTSNVGNHTYTANGTYQVTCGASFADNSTKYAWLSTNVTLPGTNSSGNTTNATNSTSTGNSSANSTSNTTVTTSVSTTLSNGEGNAHGDCSWGWVRQGDTCVKEQTPAPRVSSDGNPSNGAPQVEETPEPQPDEATSSQQPPSDDPSDLLTGAVVGGGSQNYWWLIALAALISLLLAGAYWRYRK